MSLLHPLRVAAYAGASHPEYPTAVWLQARRLEVQTVIRQWRTPDALHFLVEVENLGRVELIYHVDAWYIRGNN